MGNVSLRAIPAHPIISRCCIIGARYYAFCE
jgi:hypothetical protein